jgi:hypothetical protein
MQSFALFALILLAGCSLGQPKAKPAAKVLPLPRVTGEEALRLLQAGEVITASYNPDSGKIVLAETQDPTADIARVIQQSDYWCNDNGNLHLPGEMYPINNPQTGIPMGEWGFGANCEYVEKTFSKGY